MDSVVSGGPDSTAHIAVGVCLVSWAQRRSSYIRIICRGVWPTSPSARPRGARKGKSRRRAPRRYVVWRCAPEAPSIPFSICMSLSLLVSLSACEAQERERDRSQIASVSLSLSLPFSVSNSLSLYLSVLESLSVSPCLSPSLSVSLRRHQFLSVCLSVSPSVLFGLFVRLTPDLVFFG